jgi:N-methylhydantoinase A
MAGMLLGVDVGGTFTDAVLLTDGAIHTAKVPSTPADQSQAVLRAVEEVLERGAVGAERIEAFSHGMTVGTNALLERRGARTALIATAGFTDLLEIARQDRPSLYHLCADRPAPLAPPELRIGVDERVGPDGVAEPLEDAELERVVAVVDELDCEAVAICLLFSYLDDSHEARLAAALRGAYPELPVSTSAEVLPKFREYERCSTTVIDAYLAPLLRRYLGRLGERCAEAGLPEPTVMQSSGGVAPLAEAAAGAAWSVLSGPAGGAVGAATLARLSGAPDALGLDMGGTSCDVCVIEGGEVRRTAGRSIGQRPIHLPMVDVHTVGAGGGSIGWRDAGGALRTGPRSAGADPGPACYGEGGTEPTVTDANLLLGYLSDRGRLAGGVELDGAAARAAIERLAGELGIDPIEAAAGIIRVANQEMVGALRVVTVERGVDPRGFALLAFGGAGGMHAAAIAAELEIDRVICPRAGGVLSALGLIAGDRRRDVSRTVMLSGEALTAGTIAARVEEMAKLAGERLDPGHRLEVVYEIRYAGQAFELDVAGEPESDPAELREAFAAEHQRRYGYRDDGAAIELVGIRLAAIEAGVEPDPTAAAAAEPRRSRRRAYFDGFWTEVEVVGGELRPDAAIDGPAVLELPETTLVVPPGARAEVDSRGTVDMRLGGGDGA